MPVNPPYRRPGKKKAPPPKAAPSPEDVHTGRNAPPDRKPPPAPPAPSPEDHRPPPPAPPKPPAWVISRQRRLRAAGYRVRVDGVWGPTSQHLWNLYQRGLSGRPTPVFLPPKPKRGDLGGFVPGAALARQVPKPPRVPGTHLLPDQQIVRAPDGRVSATGTRRADDAAAVQAAVTAEVRRTRSVVRRARRKSPEQMNLADLVALTIDPISHKLNVLGTGDATRVQRWLRAHGHPKLQVDGKFGYQTFRALSDSWDAAVKSENHKAYVDVSHTLYASGALSKGIPGWPQIHGPGDLIRELQGDGFGQALLWQRVQSMFLASNSRFDAWRFRTLRELDRAGTTKAGGHIGLPDLITGNLDRYLRIAASSQEDQRTGRLAGAREIGVLATSKDGREFRNRMTMLRREDAAHIRHLMAQSKHHSWWQGGLETIAAPARWTRASLIFGPINTVKGLTNPFGVPGTKNAPMQFDADIVRQSADWSSWLSKNHFWLSLGYDIGTDPLTYLIPGPGVVWRGVAKTALTMERAGYVTLRAGELTNYAALKPLSKVGYVLAQPAIAGRAIGTGTRVELAALASTSAGRAVKTSADALTTMKGEMMQRAQQAALQSMRHGYAPPPETDLANISGETVAKFRESESALTPFLYRIFPGLQTSMVKARMSLWADALYGQQSSFGAALKGRFLEVMRVNDVHRLALERANDAWQRSLAKSYKGIAKATPAQRQEAEQVAERLARDAYAGIIERSGSYFRGITDPEFEALLGTSRLAHADRFDLLMRLMQQDLEAQAEKNGYKLYDEAGKWVGAQGDEARRLRALASKNFEDENLTTIPNPRKGKFYTAAEKDAMIDGEVEAEVTRLRGQNFRREAEGRPRLSNAIFDERVSEALSDANKGWMHTPNKGWEDTREFRRVPKLYSRQFRPQADMPEWMRQVWDGAADEVGNGFDDEVYAVSDPRFAEESRRGHAQDPVEELAALHLDPATAEPMAVEKELEQLAYMLAGGPGTGVSNVGYRMNPMMGRFAPEQETGLRADGEEFRRLLTEHSKNAAQGYNEALPREMLKRWGAWQALGHAQGRLPRITYNAIHYSLQAWIFATLPLRPGWGVRNIIDNTAKVMTRGALDPRLYFSQLTTEGAMKSVFDLDLRAVKKIAAVIDEHQGTNVAKLITDLEDSFWRHATDVHAKIFGMYGMRPPDEWLNDARFNPLSDGPGPLRKPFHQDVQEEEFRNYVVKAQSTKEYIQHFQEWRAANAGMNPREFAFELSKEEARVKDLLRKEFLDGRKNVVQRWKEGVWELMATKPENFYKIALMNKVQIKALKEGASEWDAMRQGWEAVEETLFDYSKKTVIEDNLKPFFPFIDFWRKNTAFWLKTANDKPYLLYSFAQMENKFKSEMNADLPEWMHRYLLVDEIVDGLSHVPALDWLLKSIGPTNTAFDPASFFSFSPLYRAFKSENPNLPADKAGVPFLSGLIDGINDFGLSMNPLIRKPLEAMGVANWRSWQSVFPQTSLAEAFTRKYMNDLFPNGLNIENMIFDHTLGPLFDLPNAQELVAKNFNQYVQMEMANQVLRGEQPSRGRAETKMRQWFFAMSVVSYFGGMYGRRSTPQDRALYLMSEGFYKHDKDYNSLTETEKKAYQLFKRRKFDPVAFDKYIEAIPMMQAYYAQGSYAQKELFKKEHPEIVQYVEKAWNGKFLGSPTYLETQQMLQATDVVVAMGRLASELHLTPEVRKLAENSIVTPELRAFWAANDTPAEIREKHLRSMYFNHILAIQETYFAIPEDDFDAKNAFLKANPLLSHFWLQNNSHADDFKAIINSVNADLRQIYFEKKDEGGWDKANAFLREFPFMFEFTTASDKVNPMTGEWLGDGSGGGHRRRHGLSQHAQDYLAAKKWLDHFFSLPDNLKGKWLESGAEGTALVKNYFAKYSKHRGASQHAKDFLAARPLLDKFFKIAKKRGFDEAWNAMDDKQSKILRDFFRKYAHPKGHSQHAQDWLKAKPYLDEYFGIKDADKRDAWLHSGSKKANIVLDFFKKYSKTAQVEKKVKKLGLLNSRNPELNRRVKFWQHYFSLNPWERQTFVLEHAQDYGIFIYGPIGQKERNEREMDYLRKAHAHGIGDKAAMLLYVKPLLDFFFNLKTREDKALFLKANPELDHYFRTYPKKHPVGGKDIEALIEQYFNLPEHSNARSDFLKKHPNVQDYFDKRSTPAERAMHNLLEVYFGLFGDDRRKFGLLHPEIQEYFDKRKQERDNEKATGIDFFYADPRIAKFWELAKIDITLTGSMVRDTLERKRKNKKRKLEVRTERQPLGAVKSVTTEPTSKTV